MNYINNWIYRLNGALAVDAPALPVPEAAISRLALAVGVEYLVTLTSALADPDGGAFEIVRIVGGSGGSYTLERGQEGTDVAEWPIGTIIHATITAGHLSAFYTGEGGLSDSGWVQLETPPEILEPIYARRIGSVVYMRGYINIPATLIGQAITQLPEGWEPVADLSIYQSDSAGDQSCSLYPDGSVVYNAPAWTGASMDGYLTFDGWSFPVG